jgi:hypothetical protein
VSLGIEEMASSPLEENPCKDLGNSPLRYDPIKALTRKNNLWEKSILSENSIRRL